MKPYGLMKYIDAGCNEMTGIMLAVHHETEGKVCDTGCAFFDNGNCSAYKKLTHNPAKDTKVATRHETVKEEAKRRDISISQVRRDRRSK